MKSTLFLLGVALAAPVLAADQSKLLISGTSMEVAPDMGGTTVRGAAKAVIGDMTVMADAIQYDRAANTLKCEGEAKIRMQGSTVTARDCTIQLSPGEKQVYHLRAGEIKVAPSASDVVVPASGLDLMAPAAQREKLIDDFQARTRAQNTSTTTDSTPEKK